MSLTIISASVVIGFIIFTFYNGKQNKKWKLSTDSFPISWRIILEKHVVFYNSLSKTEKERFEHKVHEFILNYKITGVKTTIDIADKLLVAASAVIPIFGFDDWRYCTLDEVLIYPDAFDTDYNLEGENRFVLGMVGNGPMEGVMILSKKALWHGFQNESDKKNTAIHEFVHLIDKKGGPIDGIPSMLMDKQYAMPWLNLINKKLDEIYKGESDINPYGGTNHAEFFSVASEYFFERPKLLKQNHPKLYEHLEMLFKQDLASRKFVKPSVVIGRNSLCPCGSGKKYKKCCGQS